MIRKIKNSVRRRRLEKAGIAVELRCPTAAYGEGTGRWTINPEAIGKDSVVYSMGVGRDLSFDLALIDAHGLTVHAFDPTPASVQWARAQELPAGLVFHDVGVAAFDGLLDFHPPRRASSSHFTPVHRYRQGAGALVQAPVRRLKTIMRELGHGRIDLLKLDIEGGEYDVIDDIVSEDLPIGQLLVEFHHGYETIPFEKTLRAVEALRGRGFRVFAISERTFELSLIHPRAKPG